ncbi:hypothetical protein C8Q70DRAFT_1016765 [Cubamyces menziesii]|nr:hypothetical protein C8Q70DRAFT_1016765 [Cubamyces menziesii]
MHSRRPGPRTAICLRLIVSRPTRLPIPCSSLSPCIHALPPVPCSALVPVTAPPSLPYTCRSSLSPTLVSSDSCATTDFCLIPSRNYLQLLLVSSSTYHTTLPPVAVYSYRSSSPPHLPSIRAPLNCYFFTLLPHAPFFGPHVARIPCPRRCRSIL